MKGKTLLVKALGIICTLALLVSAVYVPVSLYASAAAIPVTDDTTVTFGFEPEENPVLSNNEAADNINMTRGGDGVGCASWGIYGRVEGDVNAIGARAGAQVTYATSGGYRLNNSDGVYTLSADTTYVVSFKIKVVAGTKSFDGKNTAAVTTVKLGYGFTNSSSDANSISDMKKVLYDVISVPADTDKFTLTDVSGTKECQVSEDWHNVSYVFTTPSDFGVYSPTLGFFAKNMYGSDFLIDDVAVTKLGANTGVAVLIDDYYGTADVVTGAVGEEITFSELTGAEAEHVFKGWCSDEERTEFVEEAVFTAEQQIFYTSWIAPVSITFVDNLNGSETVVEGLSGEPFEYPDEPVDSVNALIKDLFMGWYTSESFTEEFNEVVLGQKNIKVYAKWQSAVEDFTAYNKAGNTGVFSSQSASVDKTAGSGYDDNAALRWHYKGDAVWKVENDKNVYFADRTTILDHKAILCELKNNTTYEITYYVNTEVANTDYTVRFASGGKKDIWAAGFVQYDSTIEKISKETAEQGWCEHKVMFTTDFGNADATALYIIFASETATMEAEVNAKIDSIVIVDIEQDNIVFDPNIEGVESEYLFGTAGDEIVFPEYNNGGLQFVGWFTDKALTNKFEDTVIPKGTTMLYAKWAGVSVEFDNYTNASNSAVFGTQSMSIDKTEGIGYSDDSALRWHYKGDSVWTVRDGKTEYFADRSNVMDHKAVLGSFENNTTYEITYYVKTEAANADYTVNFGSGRPSGIWDGGFVHYAQATSYVSKATAGEDWIQKKVILTTAFGDEKATALYLLLASAKAAKDVDIEVLVDRISIVAVEDESVIIFNSNTNTDSAFQTGKAGDNIVFPKLTYKNAEFLGWYSDAACEIPFTETKLSKGISVVYAKWSTLPITFDDYNYASQSRFNFGVPMSIENQKGIGYDDDYALLWHLDGEEVRSIDEKGNPVYMKERAATSQDNIARLGILQNGTAYKITYYYRAVEGSTHDAIINFSVGERENIWNDGYKNYTTTKQAVPLKNTEWTKAETFIFTDFAKSGRDMLYIQIIADGAASTGKIDAKVLVDNVLVEKVEKPYIYFDGQNNSLVEIVSGKAGEQIKFPANPVKVGYDFTGWYMDKEATIPFEATVFEEGKAYTAYAGYKRSNSVLYEFEDYGFKVNAGWSQMGNGLSVGEWGVALSGTHAIKADRHNLDANQRVGHLIVGHGGESYLLEPDKKYVVTFNYYVEERGTSDFSIAFRAAHLKSAFSSAGTVSDSFSINTVAPLGVWKQKALIIDPSKIDVEKGGTSLYLTVTKGQDFIVYFDDIKIDVLPEGYTAYVVDNDGAESVPQYVAGKIGTSFASMLPKAPKKDNHEFLGYVKFDENTNSEELTTDKMVFTEEYMSIKANFVRLDTVQDFDGEFNQLFVYYVDYGTMDFDYEHYDSKAEGNSADNVISGRYSLRRKGTSYHFENAQILTQNQRLTAGERYTVKMKVKLGKHLQTDGAVKFASNRAVNYPWAITGDYYPIVAITDLLDGEWHEVSYTFNAVECYFSIQTPGYCELFIDDVVITRVTKDTPLSTPVEFTEYVPAKRDANGNLINQSVFNEDVTTIIDASLYVENVDILPYIIAGGAAIIVIAAALTVLLIIKKKKKLKKA